MYGASPSRNDTRPARRETGAGAPRIPVPLAVTVPVLIPKLQIPAPPETRGPPEVRGAVVLHCLPACLPATIEKNQTAQGFWKEMFLAKDITSVEDGLVSLLGHIPGTKEDKQAFFRDRGISVPRTSYEAMWEALVNRLGRGGAAASVFDLLRSRTPARAAQHLRQARRGKPASLRASEPALVDDLFFANGNARKLGELYLETMNSGDAIRAARPSPPERQAPADTKPAKPYELALSFAGEDRHYVEQVANDLQSRGVRVFYDQFEQVDLLGKDLTAHLANIYRNRAGYCVMFISQHYARKAWPDFERQHAQARALSQKREYILPVRLDDSEIPGLPPSVCYLDASRLSVRAVCDTLFQKIRSR